LRQNGLMTSRVSATLATPVGKVSVTCSESGVTAVRFGPPRRPASSQGASSDAGSAGSGPGLAAARDLAAAVGLQLGEYFAGQRRAFEVPLDWTVASRLQRHVLGVLYESVAFGETVTYGALARLAGTRAARSSAIDADATGPSAADTNAAGPSAPEARAGGPGTVDAGTGGPGAVGAPLPARAIGQLMGSNPYPVIVPCHRVVAADGLGGFSGGTGIEIKRWLLIFEGSVPPTLDWTPAGPGGLADG
jgi:methylated-DNA-[protein]-cysteine S-methyltransferase